MLSLNLLYRLVKWACSRLTGRAAISAHVFHRPRLGECPESVLFEVGVRALLGKRIFNDSDRPQSGDSGHGRVFGHLSG